MAHSEIQIAASRRSRQLRCLRRAPSQTDLFIHSFVHFTFKMALHSLIQDHVLCCAALNCCAIVLLRLTGLIDCL